MKKTLSIILVLASLLSLMAIPAMAAPTGLGPEEISCDASLDASVEKNKGNTNTLTIVVNDKEYTFVIANNAKEVYTVGEYKVYVATYGNTKIAECYFVGAPAPVVVEEPVVEEPVEPEGPSVS